MLAFASRVDDNTDKYAGDRFASNGIEAAVELSGHLSERNIWRYIQASDNEMEEALTDQWGGCRHPTWVHAPSTNSSVT